MSDQKKKLVDQSTLSSGEPYPSEGNFDNLNSAAKDLHQYWMDTYDIFAASLIKEITKILKKG
jgi:hypothetical protein